MIPYEKYKDSGVAWIGKVLPHLPNAWVDESKTKIGYEINFTKYFYEFKPLRPLEDIRKEILELEMETVKAVQQILEI